MEEFLYELEQLLTKHKASINFDCSSCSDTHGIYDAGIEVRVGCAPYQESHKFRFVWGIDANDLKYRDRG